MCFFNKNCKMASVLGLPGPNCENIAKSIIHILKAHGMPYPKQQKNVHIYHICNFGHIEPKSLRATIVGGDGGSKSRKTALRN